MIEVNELLSFVNSWNIDVEMNDTKGPAIVLVHTTKIDICLQSSEQIYW